jgi:hypothetical protein
MHFPDPFLPCFHFTTIGSKLAQRAPTIITNIPMNSHSQRFSIQEKIPFYDNVADLLSRSFTSLLMVLLRWKQKAWQ